MSTTSTNKQPLMVDRPLHKWAPLGATPALTNANNLFSVIGGGCTELVNCVSNDGAVIDSLSIVAAQQNTTAVTVVFFLSTSPTPFGITDANTAPVASATVVSAAAGDRTNVPLPPLTVPVPSLGGQAAPTETSKKNTGLYIEAGQILYVGISQQIVAPTPATKIAVFAQGGFF